MTLQCSPYTKAARAQLLLLPNGAYFCARPEDMPAPTRAAIDDVPSARAS
jgi:hypothetical protein